MRGTIQGRRLSGQASTKLAVREELGRWNQTYPTPDTLTTPDLTIRILTFIIYSLFVAPPLFAAHLAVGGDSRVDFINLSWGSSAQRAGAKPRCLNGGLLHARHDMAASPTIRNSVEVTGSARR